MPKTAITLPATKRSYSLARISLGSQLGASSPLAMLVAAFVAFSAILTLVVFIANPSALAPEPKRREPAPPLTIPNVPPPPGYTPPGQQGSQGSGSIKASVDLVVLHVTISDEAGQFVGDLKKGDFKVFENKVEQNISVFSREDIPVTMGLVIDNSGSMREKREQVNAAAMTFVKTSNPQDEAFVVNFNDEYYLDTDGDFTSDPKTGQRPFAHRYARQHRPLRCGDRFAGAPEKGPQGQARPPGDH